MFGVYQTSVPRRWGIAGFSLTNIPDGGVEIIDTTDMQNEPLLAQGDAISIHDTTGVSLGITFMERLNRSELANLETIATKY